MQKIHHSRSVRVVTNQSVALMQFMHFVSYRTYLKCHPKIYQKWCQRKQQLLFRHSYLSRLMGKPTICIGENKDADQLRGNREADQHLCFRYSDSTIPLLPKLLALFCACTGRFVSDLFGNHIVGFPTRRLI